MAELTMGGLLRVDRGTGSAYLTVEWGGAQVNMTIPEARDLAIDLLEVLDLESWQVDRLLSKLRAARTVPAILERLIEDLEAAGVQE